MKFSTLHQSKYKLIRNLLFHPVFIAFVATLLILIIFPQSFPKYKAEITNENKTSRRELIFWDDLENDGTSDMIYAYDNIIGTAALAVRRFPSRKIVEWDLHGKFSFNRDEYVFTGDYDENGKKEVYAFTLSNDSIYLHVITDPTKPKPTISNRFITTVGQLDGKSDQEIIEAQMDDLNGDGFKELIFGITSGFSIFPRSIFAYDIIHDTILTSPQSGFQFYEIIQEDINNDRINEVLLNGYSPGNTKPDYPYNDSSCWVMALDRHLKFLFKPLVIKGVHGSILPLKTPPGTHQPGLFMIWLPPFDLKMNERIYKIDSTGKIIAEKEIAEISSDNYGGDAFMLRNSKGLNIITPSLDHFLYFFDTTFHLLKKIYSRVVFGKTIFLDIDEDGNDEILTQGNGQTLFGIFRLDLNDPVILDLSLAPTTQTRISLKKVKDKPPLLFINSGELQYTILYTRNPFYYLKWVVYLGIYCGILLFTLLVSRIQKSQLQRRFNTEKKITELQLKIVRNQMDPHFTMNAINSVMDAISRQEGEKAQQNLLHFSKMYRSLVLSADKIKRSIEDELDFTRNYLELEKFRMKGKFTYSIEISQDVNLTWEVPKMIIQSPVENAVKHGLYELKQAGLITIRAYLEDGHLVFQINDNGVGRQQTSTHASEGTGKGIKIMEEFLELYEKITGIRITSSIVDLYTHDGHPAGTNVTISIPIS
jgi:anti-sigma regulatory factor (Ser/Thr protein kinase)